MLQPKPIYVSKGLLVIYYLMFALWVTAGYPFFVQLVSYDFFKAIDAKVVLFFEGSMMVLGLLLLRSKADMAIMGSFLVLNFIGTVVVNQLPLIEWFNGLRFYMTLIFLLPVMRYAMATPERRRFFMELMDRSLYLLLWLQGPTMIYQLWAYGGWDYGGGTLGFYQSGVCSELIYMISFYLMLRRWDYSKNYFRNLANNWLLIVLLYPSFLNETKASVFFMMLYFILLIPFNKKMIRSLLIALPAVVAMMWGFHYIYMQFYNNRGEVYDIFSLEYLDYYVLGDDISVDLMEMAFEKSDLDEEIDLQRGLKWAALPMIMDDNGAQSWIWGNGTGTDKGHSETEPSRFAQSYRWLLQGTMMTLEMILIECGIWGAIWFICAMIVLFNTGGPHQHNKRQMVLYLLGMLTLVVFYNTSMNILPFCIIFYYMAMVSSRWDEATELGNIRQGSPMITLGGIFHNVKLHSASPILSPADEAASSQQLQSIDENTDSK